MNIRYSFGSLSLIRGVCVCKPLNGQLWYFFPFKGIRNVIFIWNNEPIYLEVYFRGGGGVAPHNLQLFKASVLVMNYFVISTVMRFIFNNCNNYFIKKRSHALRLSHQSLIKRIILPRVLSAGCPAEIALGVNNVCVGSKQSYLQRLGFHLPADTGRRIKKRKDTNVLYLIKSLREKLLQSVDF